MSAAVSLLANITVKSNTSCAFILALMVQPCLWLKTVTTLNKVSLDIFYEARWIILYTCMQVSLHGTPCTLAAMRPPRAGLLALTIGSIKLSTRCSCFLRLPAGERGPRLIAKVQIFLLLRSIPFSQYLKSLQGNFHGIKKRVEENCSQCNVYSNKRE